MTFFFSLQNQSGAKVCTWTTTKMNFLSFFFWKRSLLIERNLKFNLKSFYEKRKRRKLGNLGQNNFWFADVFSPWEVVQNSMNFPFSNQSTGACECAVSHTCVKKLMTQPQFKCEPTKMFVLHSSSVCAGAAGAVVVVCLYFLVSNRSYLLRLHPF